MHAQIDGACWWGKIWANSFVMDIVSSVAAAALIAVAALAISWIRNIRLERKLTRAVDANGVGIGYDPISHSASFTLQIHNYANATVRVRSVVFVAERFRLELKPDPKRHLYQTPLSNEMNHKKFGRKHLATGSLSEDNNPHAMLLPAKTMAIWHVEPDSIGQFEWIITQVYVAFEYATIFGNSALIRMGVKGRAFDAIKQQFEPLAKAIHTKTPYDFMWDVKPAPPSGRGEHEEK